MRTDAEHLQSLSPEDHARLAHHVMRRQANLSLRVALVFIVLIFGIPLFNYYAPDLANHPFHGFTVSWFVLGVLFFPITWALSTYFVSQSDKIEGECTDWRAILGIEAGEPLEPAGVEDVKPAFIESDLVDDDTEAGK